MNYLASAEIELLRAHLDISVYEFLIAEELHELCPDHAPLVDVWTYFDMYAEFCDAIEELAGLGVPHVLRYGRKRKDNRLMAHQPKRGDEVEKWLEQWRDRYQNFVALGATHLTGAAESIDDALHDYRVHADIGLALGDPGEHNCRFEYCTAPRGRCPNPE